MAKIKKRLDILLVELGFFDDIEKARRSILAHEVKINTTYATSVATLVELDNDGFVKEKIFVKNKKEFVSRGGYKLQKALDVFETDVIGKKCLDIGSSTGGFTDCLLQYGASEVVCVDVCYGQLDWTLRTNKKVKVFEQTNIKNITKEQLCAPFDIIVADLSFISLSSLAKIITTFCKDNTVFIGLVKPQFESKHDETIKGIVVSESIRQRTIQEVRIAFEKAGFSYVDCCKSPIKGRAGNIEYLIKLIYIL